MYDRYIIRIVELKSIIKRLITGWIDYCVSKFYFVLDALMDKLS